ncbi:FtsH protease activity modulator HflK [Salinarimonas rosea]|uniref:FtsH protease activity modulator HflK n=1 Tax=Salinarimonas rosea TaxID=552063 RepID=UPI00042486A4|nr:FtsH protease activity modulator HflK [Salinarimonas rosea]
MPWSNQSGGGSRGPWGQRGGGSGGPWGGGGGGGGPSGGGNQPDLEEILRRSQDRLRNIVPGGGGGLGGKGIALILVAVVGVWLLTGFYTVRPNEVGLNLVFGQFSGQTAPGLNYNWPYPIGEVVKPNVTQVNRTEVGYRSVGQGQQRDVLDESLMLTGDENIVDIDFDVQWQIDPANAGNYVFNIADPEGTIDSIAQSSMREVIGRRDIQAILTTEQGEITTEVEQLMQQSLDQYGAGVLVRVVQLQAAVPPAQVREAFFDVNAAQQDLVRLQNEAETYASRVVPEARGEAARLVQQAEAYREQVVNAAEGQASRFNQIYAEYANAPQITRDRLFLETMERVFGQTDKVLIDQNGSGGTGVVPYLPLPEIQRRLDTQGATR